MKTTASRKLIEVKRGNVTVKIYQGKNLVNGKSYPQFTLTYYDGAQRRKKRFADLTAAHREAEFTAEKLSKGENQILNLTSVGRTIYIQAVETVRPLNVPLNVAVLEYASAIKQLPAGSTLKGGRGFFPQTQSSFTRKAHGATSCG